MRDVAESSVRTVVPWQLRMRSLDALPSPALRPTRAGSAPARSASQSPATAARLHPSLLCKQTQNNKCKNDFLSIQSSVMTLNCDSS